jgi:hypothetical protein
LRGNRYTGGDALPAEPVDLELVMRGPKSVSCRHVGLDAVHLRTLELDDRTTVQADEMLMDRLRREAVFIPLEALSEVELSHELTSYEKIQGPIDRRLANSVTVRSEHALDLVHRKVLARSKHDLRHRLPLMGDWQSLLS